VRTGGVTSTSVAISADWTCAWSSSAVRSASTSRGNDGLVTRSNSGLGSGTTFSPLRCFRIFSWSRRNPCMSASGFGGQPGTYTSTGRNVSTPGTTL
jgi:hypothetical protein